MEGDESELTVWVLMTSDVLTFFRVETQDMNLHKQREHQAVSFGQPLYT